MTTARKPVQSPKQRLTRAPIKPKPDPTKNVLIKEIIQRVRRVIRDRGITISTAAAEIDVNDRQLAEWVSCFRSFPFGDPLAKIFIWLFRNDRSFKREFFESNPIVSVGIIGSLRSDD